MEPTFKLSQTADKEAAYEEFLNGFRPFIEGETDEISIYANTSAALKEAFNFFWVGFYIVRNDELRLGPFQGNVACMHIKHGRGVCGTAWAKAETQVVPDVELFPGHIACSSLSRSEIVVPLFRNGEVIAVLDIDSEKLNTFDETDKKYLEEMCEEIVKNLK
jgi:GAF domain-containing protein